MLSKVQKFKFTCDFFFFFEAKNVHVYLLLLRLVVVLWGFLLFAWWHWFLLSFFTDTWVENQRSLCEKLGSESLTVTMPKRRQTERGSEIFLWVQAFLMKRTWSTQELTVPGSIPSVSKRIPLHWWPVVNPVSSPHSPQRLAYTHFCITLYEWYLIVRLTGGHSFK